MTDCMHNVLHKRDYFQDGEPNYECATCSVQFYVSDTKSAKETGREGGLKLVEERGTNYMKELGKKAAAKRWGK